jgi:hypothetical protein
MASNYADLFTVMEASLTSVKYAFYQALGFSTLRAFGLATHHIPSATLLSSASIGFVGGTIFTVPYLILLSFTRKSPHEDPEHCCERVYFMCLGKEMVYSAVSGGVGVVVFKGCSVEDVLASVGRGLVGPFVLFTALYCLLKTILGAIRLIQEFSMTRM